MPQSASPVPANPYLPPCPGINLAPDGDPVVESDELIPINPERVFPLRIVLEGDFDGVAADLITAIGSSPAVTPLIV